MWMNLWGSFALCTNPPLAVAASSFQYWDRECNCRFFFISTKFNGLIFNMEYASANVSHLSELSETKVLVGFVGVLSVNAGERRSPSERSNPAFRVYINWCLILFTGKIRCCVFRICAFQNFILFHVITASYLLGREQKYTAGSVSSEGDSIFIAALALSNLAVMYWNCTVIYQFYNYRPYYVTITLQIEKYSLSFAHVGPDAPWKIEF